MIFQSLRCIFSAIVSLIVSHIKVDSEVPRFTAAALVPVGGVVSRHPPLRHFDKAGTRAASVHGQTVGDTESINDNISKALRKLKRNRVII